MKGPRSRPRKDRGAALVMVLWGAVVMSVIAAAAAREATSTAVIVNTGAELTRARALADGGVRAGWTAFADGRINALGSDWACRSGDDLLLVRLRPEMSRVDINIAAPEMLAALFVEAGATPQAAERLAESAIAYRNDGIPDEQDESIEAPVAEDELAAAPAGTMRAGMFQTIEELGYLPGMDAVLFRAIADDVTVFTRALDIDRRFASPLVKRAMDAARFGGGDDASIVEAEGPDVAAFEGSLMDVRAIAVTASGAVFVRQAVVEGPLDAGGVPRTLRFVQGHLAADEVLPAAPDAPPCATRFAQVRRPV